MRRLLLGLLYLAAINSQAKLMAAEPYCQIRVVDEATGRGVPLVELETVNNICLVTDSAGNIAFHEPGLVGREVFFHVRSHGYEYPADGFGIRGVRLKVVSGSSITLKLRRRNIAERLYRITGGGIYRDTLLLGEKPPIAEPVLNADVWASKPVPPCPSEAKSPSRRALQATF